MVQQFQTNRKDQKIILKFLISRAKISDVKDLWKNMERINYEFEISQEPEKSRIISSILNIIDNLPIEVVNESEIHEADRIAQLHGIVEVFMSNIEKNYSSGINWNEKKLQIFHNLYANLYDILKNTPLFVRKLTNIDFEWKWT